MTENNRKSFVLSVEINNNKIINYETIHFVEKESKLIFEDNENYQE